MKNFESQFLRGHLAKSLAGLILVVGILALPVQSSAQESSKQYGGSLDPKPIHDEWDFGYVPVDYKMIYIAPLKNIGADTLQIEDLVSTCECTSATTNKRLIAPGDSALATISFDTKKFYGPQSRFVEVHSTDPKAPERLIQFRSVVGGRPEAVDMLPRNILNLDSDQPDTLIIKNYIDKQLPFRVVFTDPQLFTVNAPDSVVPANGYLAITIHRNKDLAKGTYLSTLTLEFAADPPVRMSTALKFVKY